MAPTTPLTKTVQYWFTGIKKAQRTSPWKIPAIMDRILLIISILLQAASPRGSHSLWVLITYIKGETQFPKLAGTFMLDDIIVGYYDSETRSYATRGNTTNEDDVVDPNHLNTISNYMIAHFMRRSHYLKPINHTESHVVYQVMFLCEQLENDKPGQMITKNAFRGSTVDELHFLDAKFTYQSSLNYTAQQIKLSLELSMWRHETIFYPACIQTLKNFLKKRGTQVNRKVKPRVRLIQKANSDSGGFRVSCLATGFYPRHINLTLLRDGQPVSDHEITGGDLLPNGDGTYQMRKSLEISGADKHTYTCSATHLSLDNKLDVTLEYDHGEPFKSVIPSVLMVLALTLVFGATTAITAWKRRRAGKKIIKIDMGSENNIIEISAIPIRRYVYILNLVYIHSKKSTKLQLLRYNWLSLLGCNMENILLFLLSLPIAAPKGSHSLCMHATYIKGQTSFPEFSYVLMLDDVRVLYYNGETKTLIPRGNTTAEDDVFDANVLLTISDNVQSSFLEKWVVATKNVNKTYSVLALQRLVVCELKDDGEPGQMITRDAVSGSTTDELLYVDKNFTYQGNLNVSALLLNVHLKISMWNHEHLYQPFCIKTLKGYLKKRRNQVNRKVKPKVRLLQKKLSSGSRVSCLATGFYPRHINLTLLRDGQPVSDHEITGGDLLPNGDGTYQMRKSLEISAADKHTYTCSATHLSLDNKLDVTLEFDHGEPLNLLILSVLMVLALMVFGAAAAITAWKRRRADSIKMGYSTASASEESVTHQTLLIS
ncbi:uncharacterized protein [Pseudorasbora parva]|uniref:uncharacterized protein n=1 Tax=Pseudorasbora parva TaxID=51549 RepID=UPI00351E3559